MDWALSQCNRATVFFRTRRSHLVDNGSTDRTIDRALAGFDDIKILALEKYNPSVALNIGVAASSCDYCVCLSAHCVPESDLWLESLVAPLRDDQQIAATYGRQLPLPSSSPRDKRDLWLTFGLDDVLQKKEPFLHNANAAYRACDLLEEPLTSNCRILRIDPGVKHNYKGALYSLRF